MAEQKGKKSPAKDKAVEKDAQASEEKQVEKAEVKVKKDKPKAEKTEKKKEPAKKRAKKSELKTEETEKAEKKPEITGKKAEKAESKKKPAKAKKEKSAPQAVIGDKKYPRLQEKYLKEVVPALIKKFAYKNIMEVPKLSKITLNAGVGGALQNKKLLESAIEEMTVISGQKAVTTYAKRSVSNFKLREGTAIGCKVTLRREWMYEFLDRFISMAVPRIRDFRGLSDKSFDGFGNYNLGIKEQIIFPEINYDKVESIHGFNISLTTTAKTDEEAKELLTLMGMPFVRHESDEVSASA